MTQPTNAPDDDNDSGTQPSSTNPPSPADIDMSRLNSENRKYRLANKQLAEELERLKAASATENEQAVMRARSEGEATYKAKWRDAVAVNAALGRLASKGITATDLAVRALDLSDVDVDLDSGRVDLATIDSRIEELIARYPILTGASTDTTDSRPPVNQVNANGQRRVTQEELISADGARRNELLREILRR